MTTLALRSAISTCNIRNPCHVTNGMGCKVATQCHAWRSRYFSFLTIGHRLSKVQQSQQEFEKWDFDEWREEDGDQHVSEIIHNLQSTTTTRTLQPLYWRKAKPRSLSMMTLLHHNRQHTFQTNHNAYNSHILPHDTFYISSNGWEIEYWTSKCLHFAQWCSTNEIWPWRQMA